MLRHLDDNHPMSPWAGIRNLARQYDFMESAFILWQNQNKPFVTLQFIQELNWYAVHLLSTHPGSFRWPFEIDVDISDTPHVPPKWQEVESHMRDFMQRLDQMYKTAEPLETAAYVLWRLNWIHPFVQGNGRTSRALCYFVICQKLDLWLPGGPIIPERIRASRDEYCKLLMAADAASKDGKTTDLSPIASYLGRLLSDQLQTVQAIQPAP